MGEITIRQPQAKRRFLAGHPIVDKENTASISQIHGLKQLDD